MSLWIKIKSPAAESVKIGIDTAILHPVRLYLLREQRIYFFLIMARHLFLALFPKEPILKIHSCLPLSLAPLLNDLSPLSSAQLVEG